ncbi:MAG: dihydrofolate reductase [Myxococcales bacterium]|nr:dihydrofolate reductase [Myxococcales bacterium]
MPRLRVYIACSLDGFIAGPDGDLSWLPQPSGDEAPGQEDDFGYADFISGVGALLMGRTTYDAVRAMGIPWPYERSVVVATHRPLDDAPAGVSAAAGDIGALVETAARRAGGKDVYIDGGALIRQALDAGLVDEMCVTVIPVILGAGHPLFAGVARRQTLSLVAQRALPGGLVQLTYRLP